ncbi:MAG TPA: hypothetical protein VFZ84_12330 [Burkholderiales bacterium]
MKNILLAFALGAPLAAFAAPYAPQEFDFSGLASGTIEQVREAPRDIHAFEEAMVHKINPNVRRELLIRLDDGRVLTVLEGARPFEAGQRVRIVAGRVERE